MHDHISSISQLEFSVDDEEHRVTPSLKFVIEKF